MRSKWLLQIGVRCMLCMLLAAQVSLAQEADELEPSVDTSATLEPAVDTSTATSTTQEQIEPVVSAPVLDADVTRQESGNRVMDRLELGRTEITGNQELPKVLYIVPWQQADPGDLMGKPINSLLDEVLAPLDREEFTRQVDYYDDLYGEQDE